MVSIQHGRTVDYLFSVSELQAFLSIVAIDIVMSGDNAIIIGMAAAGLPGHLRRRAIVIGIMAATVLRIAFAAVTVQLLQIVGLTLAGGLLLLWVCWKMWRELRSGGHEPAPDAANARPAGTRSFRQALTMIVMADVSMSLDNVLAVAGAARDHVGILVFGLVLSIALMGVAANYVARLLARHHWIAYVGLLIVAYVAGQMIWDGSHEVAIAAGMG
jgi:YjbE family integral membrane protein